MYFDILGFKDTDLQMYAYIKNVHIKLIYRLLHFVCGDCFYEDISDKAF